ncbi:oligosaccharide biosynthesis protein Alg14 like protein [Linderina pennispora]|uniref:UDP-N-acetylglucosamine transferase subunit ALG14 n=1 Tax=Linderina pennispora TaxID=61395 RepID=A0A1Y1WK29_9FUNG|nr:oligosaccharide biosynthesis protein Alg14 like protein [Linderina pennispora]ORX73715.1 oligosaccharide biosynthesis protein Alg14 like protein [Linderina pennispora]
MFYLITISLIALLSARLYWEPSTGGNKVLCVVLGSGGHTAEMVRLMHGIDFERYTKRLYIVSESDALSANQIAEIERPLMSDYSQEYVVGRVPRSRQVGQSLVSALISAVRCLAATAWLLQSHLPDIVLCNGPGNCVIVCVLVMVLRVLGVKRIPIVHVESFARVRSLSLSGKIAYYLADRFIVQWSGLQQKYPRAEYIPNLV